MARYSELLGRRVEVTYRVGGLTLPATGCLAADSGKSVFLEQSYRQKSGLKSFRWEIPYCCIVALNECAEVPKPYAEAGETAQSAEETAPQKASLEFKKNLA